MAAAPTGARVRTRLRLSPQDEAALRAVGAHLGSLAGKDLAARCAAGRLDAAGQARSRAARKRALTAESSSRWAGTITRTSEDAYRLAGQNLRAEQSSLTARIGRIQVRLAVQAGRKAGTTRGYPTAAERYAKTVRLQALQARLARVQRQAEGGAVSVVRGGKALLRKRNNLAAAGLTGAEWRQEWEAARLFLTADGEKDKAWGNETIRWHPEQGWLEVKLPAPLAPLANRPHGRYRLSCPVGFSYRGGEVAAQAATGAVRYDISHDPARGRWYLDASWKVPPVPASSLDELRQRPVVAVDVNHGHLAAAVIAADGNILGAPATIGLDLAGLPAATRDGHLRAAISTLIATARAAGAHAIVIEDLDFAQARAEGRERHGSRPSRGKRGRAFRRAVAGIPTGKLRDRLVQMAGQRRPARTRRRSCLHLPLGCPALAAAPAGTPPGNDRSPRGSAGDRATRSGPPGQAPRDREPARPGGGGTASPGAAPDHPGGPDRTQEARPPTRPPAATRQQDQTASPDHGRQPGSPRPSGAAADAGLCPARSIRTVAGEWLANRGAGARHPVMGYSKRTAVLPLGES